MTNAISESAGSAQVIRQSPLFGRRRIFRAVRVVAVILVVWCFVAWAAARLLIVRVDLPQADAVVVLSGSSTYVERTHWAARRWLAMRPQPHKVILTNDNQRGGWSSAEQRNPFFAERAAAELTRAGVPTANVEVLQEPVSGTHDEALLIRRYVDEHKLGSILVVTSAYHSRRALWTMRVAFAGSDVKIGLESPPPEQTPSPATWWLHAEGWNAVSSEYAKLLYYHLRFR